MDKATRLDALLPGGRGVWIPIDHGASDYPTEGLQDLEATITSLVKAGVNAIVAQKGVVSKYSHLCKGTNTSMVVHYSVSTRHGGPDSDNKVIVGHADETISRGGIGVSSQVNLGSNHEAAMIERMGELNRQAHHEQLPSFGMIYARGEHLNVMEDDPTGGQAHGVRLAFEMGCDAAKSVWTGDKDSFAVVSSAAPIPVLVAGGPSTGNARAILSMVHEAMNAGASGICMGRQVFAHPQREDLARALMMIVHENADVEHALSSNGL
jgi:DhnA family fructose-bisphosphate aldolase class Ia